MCGIFGYTGQQQVGDILLEGLKALEYRGYDSAGMYVQGAKPLHAVGEVSNLKKLYEKALLKGNAGIAHTRWATHGKPELVNTHPHTDCSRKLYLVHNGIIENHKELSKQLQTKGHTFYSETDTETLTHLIEDEYKKGHGLREAVTNALQKVQGTYGLAVMHKDEPGKIIVARMGSPIVIGLKDNGYFVASDPSAILRHTQTVVYLEDGEYAELTENGHQLFTIENKIIKKEPEELDWNIEETQKEGHAHFMLKEIFEAPETIKATISGRLDFKTGTVRLGGLEEYSKELKNASRISIVACGTAYYAASVGKYMIEEYTGIPVNVDVASEYRYRKIPFDKREVVIAISQSGETADTLSCIKEAKRRGLLTLGIVNVVGSSIARAVDAGIYTHAGPEISVASTKALTAQLTALMLLTIFLGRSRGMTETEGQDFIRELSLLSEKINSILKDTSEIKDIAERCSGNRDFLFLGRKYNAPMALEGALKLKEISYIHAEGYPMGELKHGPLAMIDKHFPSFVIAPQDSVYNKNISNIEEIKARSGPLVTLGTKGDMLLPLLSDATILVPKVIEPLSPILHATALHLFAYYISVHKGLNVDRPRNLAKSVTVE